MHHEEWIDAELDELSNSGLMRRLHTVEGAGGKLRVGKKVILNLASNDYLDLAHKPQVITAARFLLAKAGSGAGASRLVTGSHPWHATLEADLAAFKGYPAALLFGSGYLANIGIISAVVGRDDAIFMDRMAHASLVDAAILSRATLHRFRHNDCDHLAALLRRPTPRGARKLVVTESIFSMDGDAAPLTEMAALADRYSAMLLVDEAHSTGVFGRGGRGMVEEHHLENSVNLSMGTLSKALGCYGGFVACSQAMRDLLVNRARTFVYTTALPPAVIGAARGALDWILGHPKAGGVLLKRAAQLRSHLQAAGLNTGRSVSQIIPVMIGDNRQTMSIATRLRAKGILVAAIRPPTVPNGTARLRLSVTLAHTTADLEHVADAVIRAARSANVLSCAP